MSNSKENNGVGVSRHTGQLEPISAVHSAQSPLDMQILSGRKMVFWPDGQGPGAEAGQPSLPIAAKAGLAPVAVQGDDVKVTATGRKGKVAFVTDSTDGRLVYVDFPHGPGFQRCAIREEFLEPAR